MMNLSPDHNLRIALVRPQIAPNTGNIARSCVATGTELHLVRPLGFTLDERQLRRSAMDFWPRLRLTLYDDLESFEAAIAGQRIWLFSSHGRRGLWECEFSRGDWLIFGNEGQGLPPEFRDRHADRLVRIPQVPGERCLNLSTAAGIGLYEALRQVTNNGRNIR